MKKVIAFNPGDEIPSNAKFIHCSETPIIGPLAISTKFYYEVPDKVERSSTTVETFKKEIDIIIIYLNKVASKNYSTRTAETRKLIFKWLKQGYTVVDFYTAIDNMCGAWIDDPKMSQYLRPKTLFGSKFEGYYNKGGPANLNDVFAELDDIVESIDG